MPITEEMEMGARELGIKLETVGGLTVWEALPVLGHQETVFRIQTSIRRVAGGESDCGCYQYADITIRFPDGSQKRPDIAIFCRKPREVFTEVTQIPDAVIEILSQGYEAKDLQVGVPFYLQQGVKDVVVLDPRSLKVLHFRAEGTQELVSPVEINLECGCVCTV